MQIIYIHGLNSDHTANKGKILDEFCQKNFPQIKVHRPNLNDHPDQVVKLLKDLIAKDPDTGLVGSSLGGFFATLMSNETGKKAVLLNPSVEPHNTLKRFFPEEGKTFADLPNDFVGMTTDGGWQMTKADIEWFERHQLGKATYSQDILLIVKQGDELLDYQKAVDFFSHNMDKKTEQSHIIIEAGGDHVMSDFDTKLAQVVQFLFGLVKK